MNSDNNTIIMLQEALLLSPENHILRMHLADLYLQNNQLSAAETEYKIILQKDKEQYNAQWGLIKVYYQLNQYDTALVICEEAFEVLQNNVDFLILFAKLLVMEQDLDKAQNLYKLALELNPFANDNELDTALRRSATANDEFIESLEKIAVSVERPSINFDHVGGMAEVKEEISLKIIQPLINPDIYKAYGKKIGGGILLYGPPGCGKTHIARATAGQVNAKFISVGISDILDMWIGSSERNLHDIFESARLNAPCVLFFDEIDALGASRSDMKQSAGRHIINQFLTELDGVESSNDGVLVLGATNTPWHLDAAFRRPGRFDRIIFVQPPDDAAREDILKVLLKDKPVKNIDFKLIAKNTKDFSGADLNAVIDIAIEDKLKHSLKSGKVEPLETNDLIKAIAKVSASTKEWFVTAKNYALYSNESGLYDPILNHLKIKKK